MASDGEMQSLLGTSGMNRSDHGSIGGSRSLGLSSKGSQHMSSSAFETLSTALIAQRLAAQQIPRSSSATALSTRTNLMALHQRKTLYETLPFVAVPGMQHREHKIRGVLSSANIKSMEDLCKTEQEAESLRQLSEIHADELIVTMPLVMAVLVAVMAQFLVGYNTGVMNAPEAVVFPGHTMLQWGMAVSAFAVGGPFGSVIGGVLANQWGRRGAMMANVWVFLTGGVLMTVATSIFQLIAARFIIGFASGLSSVVVPVYLGEIAPPTLRGTLGTCTQFALVVGILASDLFAFPFATADMWRYLFCVTPVLCVVQLLLSSFLVESPRWLLSTNSSSSSARVAIKQLRGYRFDEDVETEVDNFLCASQKHKTGRSSAHSSGALWDLLHCKEMRVLVVAAVVLQMAQQLCGINAVFYYSTSFFEGVISSPLVGTTLVGVVNVIATYVALQLMDTTARKTLLLWSCGGMLASAVVIILVLLGFMSRPVALLGVGAFVAFFEIGLGPIPWLIVAEMFDAKWVATAMSLCSLVNWVCNFFVGLMFPFMQAALGPYSFLPFGVVLLLTALFVSCNLPETYGRTVEEIQRIAGVGAGCHPREAARLTPHVHVVRGVENYDLDSQRAAATPMDENSSV